MRKHLLLFLLTCLLPASSPDRGRSGWKLVWKEDFKGKTIDESVWSRIPKGQSDWNDMMSLRPDSICLFINDCKTLTYPRV